MHTLNRCLKLPMCRRLTASEVDVIRFANLARNHRADAFQLISWARSAYGGRTQVENDLRAARANLARARELVRTAVALWRIETAIEVAT